MFGDHRPCLTASFMDQESRRGVNMSPQRPQGTAGSGLSPGEANTLWLPSWGHGPKAPQRPFGSRVLSAGLRTCVDPVSCVLALLLQFPGSPNTPHAAVLKVCRGFSLCQPPMLRGCPQDGRKQSGIQRLRLGRATTEMAFTLRLGWILFVQSKVGSALGGGWGRGCTGQRG